MTPFRMAAGRLAASALLMTAFVSTSSAAGAPSWKLDPGKSKLGFSGMQTGAKFQGGFSRYDAAIEFDPDHLEASHITVSIDLASATTNDKQRDTALPGKDWFDVPQFPAAKFETSAIRRKDAGTYEAVGNLTLRGVTKPITLPFTLEMNGPSAHVTGHAELDRSAFGIGQGSWSTDQWVSFAVAVDIDLTATRGN
ncbi:MULTISPECIES: YceI family protein [Rhizobium]|uniref:Polyisoprenoid-binding protein YceI n=1 Tax=Rhizobium miluonense TaxID=411945 RepID=A0A1C3W8P8_9HYPH|nr:YceI family protein [Rhizobium miluonense]SCB36134.1 Polyisoprenoid-binding protein YceI [Rhizobium miluonense]